MRVSMRQWRPLVWIFESIRPVRYHFVRGIDRDDRTNDEDLVWNERIVTRHWPWRMAYMHQSHICAVIENNSQQRIFHRDSGCIDKSHYPMDNSRRHEQNFHVSTLPWQWHGGSQSFLLLRRTSSSINGTLTDHGNSDRWGWRMVKIGHRADNTFRSPIETIRECNRSPRLLTRLHWRWENDMIRHENQPDEYQTVLAEWESRKQSSSPLHTAYLPKRFDALLLRNFRR